MQLLRHIYQIGGDLNGVTFDQPDALWNDGNSYIVDTGEGLILFDCGCGDTFDQLLANMRYWGLNPDNIRYAILTHPHFDHAGGAYLFRQRGVRLLAIRETAEAVAAGDERCCGYLYHKTFTPVEVDQVLVDGEEICLAGLTITVMHLPGHSMGCTAFFFLWEGKRVVISGDVIGTLLSGDFGWSGSIDFNKTLYIDSLRRFARIDTDVMLPGHGMSYFHQPRRRVEDALNAALMQWR
ncbi:MAG: MBL fold metallo-hydrolase [Siphonobacter aquaeclarae]|nr:MBL fold metallo-hydrolase [Siphonobacter aquaeclarae]